MNDFAYLAILVAFFGLAALLVLACDRVLGADKENAPLATGRDSPEATDLAA